jgi:glycopeptide antibiotics resistance protein
MQTTVALTPHVRWRAVAITIASLLMIGFATLLPESHQRPGDHFCIVCGSVGGVDVLLNVLLFLPLGVGLALSGLAGKRALLLAFGLSALIETTQFFFIQGRDATVGDVLTNTFGACLGFALARHARSWLQPSRRMGLVLSVAWGTAWLVIQWIASYGFAPSLPDSRYYGQLARSNGDLAVFEGRVISASVNDVVIPNSEFADSRAIRRALLDGVPLMATVVSAGPTDPISRASIVRVADSNQQEIALLAQQGADLVFAIRTGADVLRLRRPLFAIPLAFEPRATPNRMSVSDTLRLSGRYTAREVTMDARTKYKTASIRIPFSPSLGWVLALPFDWNIEGTRAESILGVFWTACLLIPFGYWVTYAGFHSRAMPHRLEASVLALVAALPILTIGFVLFPYQLGQRMAAPVDLFAAFVGVLSGYALASVARVSRPGRAT